jgi:hypothetical protein
LIARIKIPAQGFRLVLWILRLGIGGAFIYEEWAKNADPVDFAARISTLRARAAAPLIVDASAQALPRSSRGSISDVTC